METSVTLDFLGELRRTNYCGALRAADEGKTVVLMGWVHGRRDHGGVIFVDLRDRDGITQVVFHEDAPAVHARAEQIRPEYVIAVEGKNGEVMLKAVRLLIGVPFRRVVLLRCVAGDLQGAGEGKFAEGAFATMEGIEVPGGRGRGRPSATGV